MLMKERECGFSQMIGGGVYHDRFELVPKEWESRLLSRI